MKDSDEPKSRLQIINPFFKILAGAIMNINGIAKAIVTIDIGCICERI
jgi:hypothetical protein